MKLRWKSGKPKAEKKSKPSKETKSLKALSKAMRHKKEKVRKDAASQLEAILSGPWAEISLAEKKIGQTTYAVVSDCRIFCAIVNVLGQGALLFVLKDYRNIGDNVACCYLGISEPDKAVSNGRIVCAGCGADFSNVKCAADSEKLYYSPVGTAIHCTKCNSTNGLYVISREQKKEIS
ncbi:MAG: hypothetical protein ACYSTI_10420 [Planctomycetota bacterium]|jgi:hypothetical protein